VKARFPTDNCWTPTAKAGQRGLNFGTHGPPKRRCGWFDAAFVRQTWRGPLACRAFFPDKLDVLDGFEDAENLPLVTILTGTVLDYLPTAADQQARCKGESTKKMPGCVRIDEGARSWNDSALRRPTNTVRRIEELIDCPFALVSTSPGVRTRSCPTRSPAR